jgi:hypothetical protein
MEPAPKRPQKQEKGSGHSKPTDVTSKRAQKQEKINDHSKTMDSVPRPTSTQPQQLQKNERSQALVDQKLSKLELKHTQKFVRAQDQPTLTTVKQEKTLSKSTPTQPGRPPKNEKAQAKDRSKPIPVQPTEILARKRTQSPLRSVFSGHAKSNGQQSSFGFGDTLLDTPRHESHQPSHQTSQNQNQNQSQNDNENRHVTLEPLEQNLIFRYLSARCHSDARLAKHGYTFPPSLNEANKRPPKQLSIKRGLFREVPRFAANNASKRRAIVLDCEMVQVEEGRRELAFLTAIDFLTGEVLIDNYVQPNAKVVNWDSRFSGVTPSAMNKAVRQGTALTGWQGARSRLWEFMDSETILIGHSLNNDLDVLGMFHWNIFDSSIFTSEAVFSHEQSSRTWSLKTLTKELVNYDIQVGKKGHSALEDAHATRDVVIWCLRYPEFLKVWADGAREEEAARALERELKQITEREQLENKRRLEMESRVQALSNGLSAMNATDSESVDDFEGDSIQEVSTEYVEVKTVEYF